MSAALVVSRLMPSIFCTWIVTLAFASRDFPVVSSIENFSHEVSVATSISNRDASNR
ncbi:Uncharacterised protein [Segatella copri]|nr:Uncharacterised protein [Segatella copri]